VSRIKEWNEKRRVQPLVKTLASAELNSFARACELCLRTPRFNEGVEFAPPIRKPFRQLANAGSL